MKVKHNQKRIKNQDKKKFLLNRVKFLEKENDKLHYLKDNKQDIILSQLMYYAFIKLFPSPSEFLTKVIKLPYHLVSSNCVVGCSFVVTSQDDIKLLQDVAQVATNCGAQYIRVLPNCLLNENSLLNFHKQLEEALIQLNDQRFFRQNKVFAIPNEEICHQSFFRPYLSEVPWKEDGEPGSVYPCDSVVLNDAIAKFDEKFQLTKLENILEYLNGNIIPNFMPKHDCKNCVFTKNVKLLGDFKRGLIDDRTNYQLPIIHEEFV
jgi:hypothetical protein